jgi:hypothetical protein
MRLIPIASQFPARELFLFSSLFRGAESATFPRTGQWAGGPIDRSRTCQIKRPASPDMGPSNSLP